MIGNQQSALLIVFLFSTPAFAYVDPNSGFVLWQLLAGGVVGCILFAKRIWALVKGKKNTKS